jgi:hypothetical protein
LVLIGVPCTGVFLRDLIAGERSLTVLFFAFFFMGELEVFALTVSCSVFFGDRSSCVAIAGAVAMLLLVRGMVKCMRKLS